MSPTISIIVPAYNAESHISHLIESIQKQTFHNWELIIVNDGSTDNTLDICLGYMALDSRVRVINQANSGPSTARNTGIENARGGWITFVDADDAMFDGFLKSMHDVSAQSDEIDIAFAGYLIISRKSNDVYTYVTGTYIGFDAIRKAFAETSILHRCSPWGKLFRRSVMMEHAIRFNPAIHHSEDRLFVYEYLLHIRGIATTSCIGYIYDDTTVTSLKNQKLSYEALCVRQEALLAAARMMITHFRLSGDETFMIAKHIFGLFTSAINSIWSSTTDKDKTLILQQKFHNQFYAQDIIDNLDGSSRWAAFYDSNTSLQQAFSKDFRSINKRLCSIEIKAKLLNKFHAFLNRIPTTRDFQKAITYLNMKY